MNPVSKPATETALAHWGTAAPAWVLKLAAFCDGSSQVKAARKIGYSPALVNKVLKNAYTGDLLAVEERVTRGLSDDTVSCPVLGDISGSACLDWQGKPYCGANHHLVRMYRACRNCPLRVKGKTE